jgi:nucleoside-diphosphate-sugar epimerase
METRGTILVTGATGFVGRHLAPALVEQGWRVCGTARQSRIASVAGVTRGITTGAIDGRTDWTEAVNGVDTVVHLAALAHQTDPRHQPEESDFMRVNAEGTRCLAEAAKAAGVRRLVFISSIGAVTNVSTSVVDETQAPTPATPYGRSKLAGEKALRTVLGGSHVEWCVLRPVLVYGPGNPGNMGRLLRLVKSGLPLPLGGIKNRRSFVFVGNLVDAIVRAVSAPDVSEKVFHVADDEAVSTGELIHLIADAAERKARLWAAPDWSLRLAARCGDVAGMAGLRTGLDTYSLQRLEESLTVSNHRLRTQTGWRPQASLREGLRITLRATRGDAR